MLRFGSPAVSAGRWLTAAIDAGRNEAFIARAGARIVGILDRTRGGACTEVGLFVAPDVRRRGIGRELVAHALARPRAGVLIADCHRENTAAVEFLRVLGFSTAEQRGCEVRWVRYGTLQAPVT